MFRITPDPVFTATVALSVRGSDAQAEVPFRFRHLGRKALSAFRARIESDKLDDDVVLAEIIDGWDDVVDANGNAVPYSAAALAQMLDDHPAASTEIWNGYLAALLDYRRGN